MNNTYLRFELNLQLFSKSRNDNSRVIKKYTDNDLNRLIAINKDKEKRKFIKALGFKDEQEIVMAISNYKRYLKTKQENQAKEEITLMMIEAKREATLKELNLIKEEQALSLAKVKREFFEFVRYQVSNMVSDKVDFNQALQVYLKVHQQYLEINQDNLMNMESLVTNKISI